jgi:hypothetical protein
MTLCNRRFLLEISLSVVEYDSFCSISGYNRKHLLADNTGTYRYEERT